jgi:nicotinamidase-related amidase
MGANRSPPAGTVLVAAAVKDGMPQSRSLRFGPLDERTVHLCIDMQNLFADETPWHTPWMNRVLPVVATIAEAHLAQTVFTRFIPARHSDELPGSWRRFYRRWSDLTLERIEPRWLDLVPALARFVPPAEVIDKRVYSPFSESALWSVLRQRRAASLVITGAETDVCVLATVLDAVDHGYRVVLAADALCSSSDETHDALMTLYHRRFAEQIETADAEEILAAWPKS